MYRKILSTLPRIRTETLLILSQFPLPVGVVGHKLDSFFKRNNGAFSIIAARVYSGRGTAIRTQTNGFGDRYATVTPYPYAVLQGFEPRPSESESDTLPLHHRTKPLSPKWSGPSLKRCSSQGFPAVMHVFTSPTANGQRVTGLMRLLVGMSGFEPLILALSAPCTNRLCYIPLYKW